MPAPQARKIPAKVLEFTDNWHETCVSLTGSELNNTVSPLTVGVTAARLSDFWDWPRSLQSRHTNPLGIPQIRSPSVRKMRLGSEHKDPSLGVSSFLMNGDFKADNFQSSVEAPAKRQFGHSRETRQIAHIKTGYGTDYQDITYLP